MKSYSAWKKEVDTNLKEMTGKTSKKFPADYKTKYNQGLEPLSAAVDTLVENDYFLLGEYNPEDKFVEVVL